MGTLRGATRNGKRTAKPRARAAAPDPRTAKLAIALREHKQAIEQQAATAEILRIIADSTESATPVFEAITRAGLRLMPDCRVALFLLRDGQLHYMSHSGIADAERALRAKRFPMPLDHGLVGGAAILDRRMIHVPDILGIKGRYPISDALARESKFRALLCLPLVSRGKAIGALSLGRVLPGAFTKKQIALARTFAAQATIAIQNARQFNETKEALEQQTATADILGVISRSPTNIEPVLRAVAENAARLCEATDVHIRLVRGHLMPPVVQVGSIPIDKDRARMQHITAETVPGRAILECKTIHIQDVMHPDVRKEYPQSVFLKRRAPGFRTILVVPLVRDGAAIGTITVRRSQVRPFPDRQIKLLQTFADQAVIAIENARLFNETKEALDQQRASADILSVMAASPTDVQPVFDAVCANAARLCDAYDAVIWRMDGERQEIVGHYGPIPIPRESIAFNRKTSSGRAALEKRPLHILDLQAESAEYPDGSKFARELGFHTVLSMPLIRDDTAIGVIQIRRREARAFTDKQQELVKVFADQAVIAIENVRLFNETKEALERQTSISEVLAVISSSPTDLAPILEAVASRAAKLCDATDARIFLADGQEVRHVAGFGDLPVRTPVFPLDRDSSVGAAIIDGKPVHVADILAEGERFPASQKMALKAGYRTTLNVPLMREGKALGAIAMRRGEVRPFGERQVAILRTFADQAAIAIENARLFNETKEALERQTATAEILRVISSTPTDAQPVFEAIVESALRIFDGSGVYISLVEGPRLQLVAAGGSHLLEVARRDYPMPITRESVSGTAILDRRVINVADSQSEDAPPRARSNSIGFRAIACAPLLRQGEPIGALGVTRQEPGALDDKQVGLLRTFADQAVIAIENARLFNETKEALEKQTATADILQVLSGSPSDTQPVFDAIVQHAARLCESTYANVFRYDGERIHLAASQGGSPEALAALRASYPAAPNRKRVVGRVVETGHAVHVEDTLADAEYDRAFAGTLRLRRLLGVPLLRMGRPIGAITIGWAEPGPIQQRHQDLLKTFADQAVIAIENVRLFNETKEALEQQTATAEILKVISGSPTDVQPVFDAIVLGVSRLFGRKAALRTVEADGLHRRARSYAPDPGEYHGRDVEALDRRSIVGQAVLEGRALQWRDTLVEGAATYGLEEARKLAFRSIASAPLMRGGRAIGVISVSSPTPGLLTASQMELLTTFADQAVIAIENVRLFNETKEALERQTATAEILRVISASPTDIEPVLRAVAENAARLCGSPQVTILFREGDVLRARATFSREAGPTPTTSHEVPLRRTFVSGRALLEARTVHLEDVVPLLDSEFPDARVNQETFGFRAVLAVPMMREGEGLGVIYAWRREPGLFTPEQVALVQTFAHQAVIAIENARLFNETRESLERQTATAEILRVIGSSVTETQPVFAAIVKNCGALFADSRVGLWLIDEQQLVCHASTDYSAAPMPLDRESGIGACALEGRTIHLPDLDAAAEHYPRIRQLGLKYGYHSGLYAPLLREGKAIGGISVLRREAGAFQEKDVALLSTFASQAVIAIENVRLFNETKEALEQQTATAEVLKVISASPTSVAPVFDAILKSAVTLCGAELAAVFSYDGQLVHLGATHKWPEEAVQYFSKIYPSPPSPKLLSGRTILSKSVVQIVDSAADPDYDPNSVVTGKWRRMLGAPMLREGRPLGALIVSWRDPGETPPRQVELLQTFADQAAIAIENVRLFNETKEALEQQTATSEILKVIRGSATDIQPVFDALAANAARLCEANDAILQIREGHALRFVAHHGDIPNLPPGGLRPLSRNMVTGRAVLEGRQIHVPDLQLEAAEFPEGSVVAKEFGYRTILATPLMRDGAAIGAIMIRRRDARPFGDKHLALVKTFADQAVIAIENVRLFNETKEALDQQKASAEVLGAISGSIADTKPVFEKILASCERLFEGELVGITLADGDTVRLAAYHGPQGEQLKNVYPLPLTRESGTGWAILNARIAHFPDIEGAGVPPGVVAGCRTLRVRAIVFAPMLFEGKGIGAIWVARAQVGAFTEKQIAQLRTFADQAVIAIQNARLVNETREALDQLKASADVLGVISSSIADTRPVFDAILQSCERLFAGTLVGINILGEDGLVRIGAYHGPNREAFERVFPIPVDRESGTGLAVIERRVLHYPDIEADGVPPATMRGCRATGIRSVIFAPMLWEEKGVGAIFVGREHVGQFSDKEISLLKTFADQAVIAIQNARLFREIQEKSAQLEVANKHKSDFLANMSHELRTPLNAIIGFSEVLSDRMFGEVNEKQAEYLKDIHESGRHLLSLINDILDLSKIEAGRMELELSSFDLPGAVSNAMTLVRERAQRHGIQLGLEMDPGLGELQADERKVKQILLNLLSNAVKFTPDGGKVDVSTRKMDGKIEIAVRDTGIGIAPEDHAAVFEEFKQVGRDYTRKAEGTGLGLALTKRLVELHGGEIALESAIGKGSTFTVKLPLR